MTLIEQGAFVNLQTPRSGFTPLMTAAWYSKEANIEALFNYPELNIELTNRTGTKAEGFIGGWDKSIEPHEAELYKKLRDLFKKQRMKQSALLASQKILNTIDRADLNEHQKLNQISALIKQGEDVNQRRPVYSNRNDWHTPLLVSARQGYSKIVELLLSNGADQTIPGYPMDAIAFHKAAYMGHPEIVRMLLADNKAHLVIDAQGPNNGYTPLHDAIWHGHLDAAKELIVNGADLKLKNYEGDTPKALANRYGYSEIFKLLDN